MKIDQNTGVSLFVVATVVSAMVYGGYMAGQFSTKLERLDGARIEQRLTAIETTLNLISRRQQAGFTAIEAAPR